MANVATPEQIRAAWKDLRSFIEIARAMGELEVVEGADPKEEMGAIYELSLDREIPPVLLFEGMKGTDRKSTRLNSSHVKRSRMPSSA